MTRLVLFGGGLLLALGIVVVPAPRTGPSLSPLTAKGALQQDKVVAGSTKDFMEVRHIVLKGTNEEIGQALATIAKDRYEFKPFPSADRTRTRAQRKYIEKNYPILFDRMRGVATVFGKKVDDDGFNFSGLWYPDGPRRGLLGRLLPAEGDRDRHRCRQPQLRFHHRHPAWARGRKRANCPRRPGPTSSRCTPTAATRRWRSTPTTC